MIGLSCKDFMNLGCMSFMNFGCMGCIEMERHIGFNFDKDRMMQDHNELFRFLHFNKGLSKDFGMGQNKDFDMGQNKDFLVVRKDFNHMGFVDKDYNHMDFVNKGFLAPPNSKTDSTDFGYLNFHFLRLIKSDS